MLEVDDIHTNYGDSSVLQGVSLSVPDGAIVAVLGRNGVGKTTLIRSIAGFTPPREGRILLDGSDITRLPAHQIARRGVGLVPQGRRIFPSLTVRENLDVGRRPRGGDGWPLARILGLFPRLEERLRHRGSKLSGGEQQMLACGRALATNPRILLMDEPTEGLAPLLVRQLAELLHALKTWGTSVLLVEQHLAFAVEIADYVYVMGRGTIVFESTAEEFQRSEEVKSRFLGV